MPSPTFNGNKLFSSTDANGNTVDEGCLWVASYSQITQAVHFEGETGDHTLYHGYPDMAWRYDGYLSATSGSAFGTQIAAIQSAIDANVPTTADEADDTYKVLVDSFGTSYAQAQIRTFSFVEPPHATIGLQGAVGWLAKVLVTGVIQGQEHVGNNGDNTGGGGQ